MIALLIYDIIRLALYFSGRKWPVAFPLDWWCVPFDGMASQVQSRRRLGKNQSFGAQVSRDRREYLPHRPTQKSYHRRMGVRRKLGHSLRSDFPS